MLAVLVLLLVAGMVLAALPVQAQTGDAMKFRVTSNGGRTYCYWKVSNAGRKLVAGDYIEYRVYLTANKVGLGGIDIYCTDGSKFRDQGTTAWKDQNGIWGHPSADLRSVAFEKWYWRRLPVPTAMIGKTISRWDVAVDGTYDWYDVLGAMYDDLCVTNNGNVVLVAWNEGTPSLNALDIKTADPSVQSSDLICGSPKLAGQTVAHTFYWYRSSGVQNNGAWDNAAPWVMRYHPHGLDYTYNDPAAPPGYVWNGGAWDGYGSAYGQGFYGTQNSDWWEAELEDMKYAGVDIASLVCWADHPAWPWMQRGQLATYLAPALARSGVGVKIALFDDNTSEVSRWNYDNGRGYVTTTPMPLSNTYNWSYFYDNKIKPFFQDIPQEFWATHNGLPVSQGGRPIIFTWCQTGWYNDVSTNGTAMWNGIKDCFQRDFGVRPYVVHENWWVNNGAGASADATYTWGACVGNPSINTTNNYYVASIGPGFDNVQLPSNTITPRVSGTNLKHWFSNTYNSRKVWNSNLIIAETWNELWEGSGIGRFVDYDTSDDRVIRGSALPETWYMDCWRDSVNTSVGRPNYDATYLRTWEIPTTLYRGSSYVTTSIRNDGLLPWDSYDPTNPISLGIWLEDPVTHQTIAGTGSERFRFGSVILSGQAAPLTWGIPSYWPTGTYDLRLDMVAEYLTWFNWTADKSCPKIRVTIY